ncbi:mitochondrial protein C2orf69 homolog [Brevipalpus obovatus]|uniref:mitochondrial protein C2orf69 homolog n=1 Tax=Brevipalpus obovatus TaxID=246614 RepID=UPI003D9EE588
MAEVVLKRLIAVKGLDGRMNDILVAWLDRKLSKNPDTLTMFFHGDIQDFSENMDQTAYLKWNFENTAQILAKKFSDDLIMLIRCSHRKSFGFQKCFFDNFVQSDRYGEPTYKKSIESLKHLKCLSEQVSKNQDIKISDLNQIKLVGFSQGVTALNQIIYAIHTLDESSDPELEKFVGLIQDIYWLDGGQSWITEEKVLQTLKHRNIRCHITVSPFQVENPSRPGNRQNFLMFREFVEKLKIDSKFSFLFHDQEPSCENHFKVLEAFQP